MAAYDYHLVTHWRVRGDLMEVGGVLTDARSLPRWWPSSYLEVSEIAPGDGSGIGREVEVLMKGWLPYTLRFRLATTAVDLPKSFTLSASGELAGVGTWSFRQEGPLVEVTYDWRVRSNKALLRNLSFAMKPVFAANHYWVMRRGEESLKLEMLRRRAAATDERALIPTPPGPTPTAVLPFLRALPRLLLRW